MRKNDLVRQLRSEFSDLPAPVLKAAVDHFFDEMADQLEKNNRIEIRGFGSFFVKVFEQVRIRNPKTGKPLGTASFTKVNFRTSVKLLQQINPGLEIARLKKK